MGVVNLHPLISKNDRNIISITNKYNTDMKIFSKILMVLVSTILLQSCSKTYEIQFENLLLAPISQVLNTPDYISGCRIEIKTSEKFNIDEYLEMCGNFTSWPYGEDYSYTNNWSNNSGVFKVPSGKGQISIYSNSEKVLDMKYASGSITSSMIWEKGDVVCEFKGTLDILIEYYYYFIQGQLIWYNNDSDLYMQKKVITEGYAPNCKQYDKITTYYYPTGVVSRKVVQRIMEDENSPETGYSSETMEDIYYKQDGSEMTMADRLFENHEEYIILSTGYTDRRDNGKFYIIFMPKENGNTKGYGAIISSNKYDLLSIKIDRTFEYRIDDNEIICDEFFTHTEYSTERVNNQKRRTLEIDVDYDKNIIVKGEFVIKGWDVNCNMKPSQNGYSDWLYTTLQECIEER